MKHAADGDAGRPHRIWGAILFIIVCTAVTIALNLTASGEETAPARVTDPFRTEHETLRGHLRHMTTMVGTLPVLSAEEQKETMTHITTCMGTNIEDHAKWEEEILYPVVDKYAGADDTLRSLTITMKHEHRIVSRWIGELRDQASQPEPDIKAFARRADNLLGLVMAHFEEEEDILLPVLDAKMSADEFKKQVADKIEPSTH